MAGLILAMALGLRQRRSGGAVPPPPSAPAFLAENGDRLLLESGGFLLLE